MARGRMMSPLFFFVCCFAVSTTLLLLVVSTILVPVVVVMGTARSSDIVSPILLDKVCKKTSDYKFCTTTLLADSRSASTDDPTVLAKLALQLTSTHARVTKEYIRQLLNRRVVPGTRGNMLRCDFEYNEALSLLQSALNHLAAGTSYKELSLLTVLVHGNANTCEHGFTYVHQPSPLTSQNNKLMNLSDICTAVFTFINVN